MRPLTLRVPPKTSSGSVVHLPFRGEVDAERLVAGALAEEPWAQVAIWNGYSALLRRVLRRSIGPTPDVEDTLQEVFVQFFRSVRKLEDPGALRPFLVGIALRLAASERRRRRLRHWLTLTSDGEVPEHSARAPDEHARAALRRFYAILDDLDPDARIVFTLRHIEGLDLAEIAMAASTSLATVKRRLAKIVPIVLARVRRDPALAAYVGEPAALPMSLQTLDEVGA